MACFGVLLYSVDESGLVIQGELCTLLCWMLRQRTASCTCKAGAPQQACCCNSPSPCLSTSHQPLPSKPAMFAPSCFSWSGALLLLCGLCQHRSPSKTSSLMTWSQAYNDNNQQFVSLMDGSLQLATSFPVYVYICHSMHTYSTLTVVAVHAHKA